MYRDFKHIDKRLLCFKIIINIKIRKLNFEGETFTYKQTLKQK